VTDDESLAGLVAELSVPQKAALCLGSDFWHTAPVGELGSASPPRWTWPGITRWPGGPRRRAWCC
jgi:hypothetical protein